MQPGEVWQRAVEHPLMTASVIYDKEQDEAAQFDADLEKLEARLKTRGKRKQFAATTLKPGQLLGGKAAFEKQTKSDITNLEQNFINFLLLAAAFLLAEGIF